MQRSKKQLAAGPTPLLIKKGPAAAFTSLLFLLIFITFAFISSLSGTLPTSNSKSSSTIANETLQEDFSGKQGKSREQAETSRKRFGLGTALNCSIENEKSARSHGRFESEENEAGTVSTSISNQTLAEDVSRKQGKSGEKAETNRKRIELGTVNCSVVNEKCARRFGRIETEENDAVCPEYFRWIHEDLRRWKEKGISREMVEAAKKTAHFRLVVKEGRAYVEKYKKSIQTRDVFTIWGILQLLRRYPGRVPDLELMFDCDDLPVIRARDYRGGANSGVAGPPPLFRYCGDRWTEDIVFPDWSFWGWAEINIRPWEHLLKEIEEGNKKIQWKDREPYAYWKGNPFVAETRQDLLNCNVSNSHDWNARLFLQDWIQESQQGFNQSNLANQCTYRYKIYIEGFAWSVSEKYILACDSVTLLVKPRFYDFFIRRLQPMQHYWPIRDTDKCKSIKHAVDWGNSHVQKAQEIGKAASKFIQEELKMDYVYDYMFHLLNEYAKLLKFKPKVPEGAMELCEEPMVCTRSGLEKKFMTESMVKEPSKKDPCSLPPPFEPTSLRIFYGTKLNLIRRVEKWEDKYLKNSTQKLHTRV